jgi:hypothetical protein
LDPILITDSIPVTDCDTIPIDREISDHDPPLIIPDDTLKGFPVTIAGLY